jgi:hypothetical protein
MNIVGSKFSLLILITFVSFSVSSCTQYSEFETVGKKYLIKPIGAGIEEVLPVVWRVGPRKKQKVSKGFELKIKLPQLKSEHIDTLLRETDINSWLIVLRKKTLTKNKILNRSYVPMIVPGTTKSKIKSRMKQMKFGYIRVYYPAAALSNRFENFPCPAFKHSLIITDANVQKMSDALSPITISPSQRSRINQKVNKFEYNAKKVNGGNYLVGNYEVEIALYNFENKMIYSNFYGLSQRARILKEKSVTISGCENFVIPDTPPPSDGIKQFKFGR